MTRYWEIIKTLYNLKYMQHWNIENIHQYQIRRFKRLLQHAYNSVPMYREFYDSKRFKPSAVQKYEDIEEVPIITKDIIRSFPTHKRVDPLFSERNVSKETTSGSTGEPIEIWRSQTESVIQTLKGIRLLREWGYSPFDHTVRLWDGEPDHRKSIIQKFGLVRRNDLAIQEKPINAVNMLKKMRCDVLYATRSSLDKLADEVIKEGIKVRPHILVSIGEILTNEHRKKFMNTFGCKTVDLYGSEETGSIAWECPDNPQSLHIEMETVVVNSHDVEVTPNGTMGSIVLTNLENFVMPFIRYDLGDRILMPENDQCSCGRTLPVLGKVFGRDDDILEYKEKKFYWNFFYNYFKDYLYINKYKIVQTKEGKIEFRILLVDNNEENRKRCIADLSSAFDKEFFPLNVQFVDSFTMSSRGKFKVLEKES